WIVDAVGRARGPTPDEHQVVRADAGRPSATAPDPPSRWDGADMQFPGHPRRRDLSRSPVRANGEHAGPVRFVQPRPEPAGLGLLDVPPETLGQWHLSTGTACRARAAAGPTRWSTARRRGGEAPPTAGT